jgi:hypothetical protein
VVVVALIGVYGWIRNAGQVEAIPVSVFTTFTAEHPL